MGGNQKVVYSCAVHFSKSLLLVFLEVNMSVKEWFLGLNTIRPLWPKCVYPFENVQKYNTSW